MVIDYKYLTPPQQDIISSGLLNSGFNCILHMPTGSGKTWLAEHAICQAIAKGYRAIYLTPLRALAEQLYKRWQQIFHTKVGIFTGDYAATPGSYPVPYKDASVLIMTPEKLDACTRHWRSHWHWLPEVSLLVIDEIHLIGDPHRGPRLEGTLSRFTRLNPFTVYLGLSATLGNVKELTEWLNGISYESKWRPIPLQWRSVRFKKAIDKPQLLHDEVLRTINNGGKSLVFVESRRRAEKLTQELRGKGTRAAFHHAGLNHYSRQQVENEFTSGLIDVIIATSTLEMGLNLPVRQVILYDIQSFTGQDFIPLSTNSVWQRAGRAGRPGLDSFGEVVLFVPAWDKGLPLYEKAHFESIKSHLHNTSNLAEQLVAEVSSGLASDASQLERFFQRSLAGHQKNLPSISSTIVDMCEAGMLVRTTDDRDNQRLKATRLGYVATRHLLSPSTILRLKHASHNNDLWCFIDLFLIICSCSDIEPILPVNFEELESLAAQLSLEPSLLLDKSVEELSSTLGIQGRRLLSALKMALVLRLITRGSDTDYLAGEFNIYLFELQRLRENSIRLLAAWQDLLKIKKGSDSSVSPESDCSINSPDELHDKVLALKIMIEAGIDEYTVTLTFLPGIGPTLAHRLQKAGISDIEELSLTDAIQLSNIKGISFNRAQQWINQAEDLGPKLSAFHFKESGRTRITSSACPIGIDPYRLRRALDLKVNPQALHSFIVTGGLEPHLVSSQNDQLYCDCPDFHNGNQCKHCLAILLSKGDKELLRLKKLLTRGSYHSHLDLNNLWFHHFGNNVGRYAFR